MRAIALVVVICLITAPTVQGDDPRPLRIVESPVAGSRTAATNADGSMTFCKYPAGRPVVPDPAPPAGPLALIGFAETEPNGSTGTANVLPLGTDMGEDVDVDVTGMIDPVSDVDAFRVTLKKGDIIGAATVTLAGGPDTVLAVFDAMGSQIFSNNNHGGLNGIYPPGSPWPVAGRSTDSAMTFIAPADDDFFFAVTSLSGATSGSYTLRLRLRRAQIETVFPTPVRQILFIDFDGATINANALFGEGRTSATMSPLSAFLSGWGLAPGDENAVIDAILARLDHVFDDLRDAALNGDFPVDMMVGHYDIEIRNSRDHPDPFGQANVSRVIVGGTIAQTGISTIGIAEFVDPGNVSTDDTAIVLLDLLSAGPGNLNSVLSLPRDPGLSLIDAIGKVVGNVVAHEAGHFLGCWHTRNDNATACIMDRGGDLENLAGVGNDGILGTMDDPDNAFTVDEFESGEGVGFGDESTNVVVSFGLSTGGLAADNMEPGIDSTSPAIGANVGTFSSISVTFDENIAGLQAARLTVNGSPAVNLSGSGAGPFTFSGFAPPADGPVTVVLNDTGVTDLSGNTFISDMWTYSKTDCNNNGVFDAADLASNTSDDCNGNNVPDECDPDPVTADAGAAQIINAGESVVLGTDDPASGGVPPYTFAWTLLGPGVNEIFTEANPAFQFDAPGVFNAQLTVTDSLGCQAKAMATITVNALPVDNMNAGSPPCGVSCGPGMGMMAAVVGAWIVLVRRRRR
ncbi:MAG: hypothetical protein HBSAPP02_08740 [Phycisphaerae bacterium]|nr:MAG: hypothetical protein HRU71_13345 [Planctomycetia bacterium]RIK71552.1 MAG: hypothetical protein DCC66_01040 [Planctomycetota bacterium]GJQ25842.1 MAG: hypothetical protein HBSAPP02_08740 [Phycisphaerae bacterium]